jgi:hypothetical protein
LKSAFGTILAEAENIAVPCISEGSLEKGVIEIRKHSVSCASI